MIDSLYVMIPVPVVEVCDDPSRCQEQVGGIFLDTSMIRNALDEKDLPAIRRELESFDAAAYGA